MSYQGIEKFFEAQYQATLKYSAGIWDGITELCENAESDIERKAYENVLELIKQQGIKYLNKFS